jgi:predicted nucleic acid-binding OB-fold protein
MLLDSLLEKSFFFLLRQSVLVMLSDDEITLVELLPKKAILHELETHGVVLTSRQSRGSKRDVLCRVVDYSLLTEGAAIALIAVCKMVGAGA